MENDGHREPVSFDEMGDTEEITPEGQSELDKVLEAGKIGGTFSMPGNSDTARILMQPGRDVLNLLMRADIPNKRFAIAVASLVMRTRNRHRPKIEEEILMILAGLVGKHARRAELVGDVLIGQKRVAGEARSEGIGDKLRKLALG